MRTLHTTYRIAAVALLFFMATGCALAAPVYEPLVGIPGLPASGVTSLPEYINRIYILIIVLGSLFGVIKIAIAGVKYSTSGSISSKDSAKKDIQGVLLGLAILLLPFIVLSTINPELTRLDVLHSAPRIDMNRQSGQDVTLPGGTTAAPAPATNTSREVCIRNGGTFDEATNLCTTTQTTTMNTSYEVCMRYRGTFDSATNLCTYTP